MDCRPRYSRKQLWCQLIFCSGSSQFLLQLVLYLSLRSGLTLTLCLNLGRNQDSYNYHPVVLTAISSEIMDSLVASAMEEHLASNCPITSVQHGFTKRKSCVNQLLHLSNDWLCSLEEPHSSPVDVLLLNFAHAFNKMPHDILLQKLSTQYNICGNMRHWAKSFLCGHSTRVTFRGAFSDWAPVTSGVPTGSVIGPLFFLNVQPQLPPKWRYLQMTPSFISVSGLHVTWQYSSLSSMVHTTKGKQKS